MLEAITRRNQEPSETATNGNKNGEPWNRSWRDCGSGKAESLLPT